MVAEQNVTTMQVNSVLLINQTTSVLYWSPESNYKYYILRCGLNFEIFLTGTLTVTLSFAKPQVEVSFMPLFSNYIFDIVCNLSSSQLQVSVL